MNNVSHASVSVTRRRILEGALGTVVLGLLGACAPAAPPPAAPAATTAPSAPVAPGPSESIMFRMDWLPSGRHIPFYVARDKGWYAEQGLSVEIGESKGSGQAAQFVATGNATFGYVDGSALVKAVAAGMTIKSVFLSLAKSQLGYTFPKDLNIKVPKDLEGKTYAAVPSGSSFQLWPAFAAANGIDTSKVTVANTSPDSNVQVVATRKADFTDGGLGYEDYLLGEAGRPADMFLLAEYGFPSVGTAIVASTSTIAQSPDMIRRFLDATFRGYEYALANETEGLDIFMKRNSDQKRGAIESQFRAGVRLFSKPPGAQTEQQWQSTIDLTVKNAKLERTPKPSDVYTNDFLPKR